MFEHRRPQVSPYAYGKRKESAAGRQRDETKRGASHRHTWPLTEAIMLPIATLRSEDYCACVSLGLRGPAGRVRPLTMCCTWIVRKFWRLDDGWTSSTKNGLALNEQSAVSIVRRRKVKGTTNPSTATGRIGPPGGVLPLLEGSQDGWRRCSNGGKGVVTLWALLYAGSVTRGASPRPAYRTNEYRDSAAVRRHCQDQVHGGRRTPQAQGSWSLD